MYTCILNTCKPCTPITNLFVSRTQAYNLFFIETSLVRVVYIVHTHQLCIHSQTHSGYIFRRWWCNTMYTCILNTSTLSTRIHCVYPPTLYTQSNIQVYMCVYTHVHIYIHVYVCIRASKHVYICAYAQSNDRRHALLVLSRARQHRATPPCACPCAARLTGVCACVCVCVCACVYVYIYIYIYAYICIYMYTCRFICIYLYIVRIWYNATPPCACPCAAQLTGVCACVCVCVCMCIDIYIYAHICVQICIYVDVCAYTCVYCVCGMTLRLLVHVLARRG